MTIPNYMKHDIKKLYALQLEMKLAILHQIRLDKVLQNY